MKWREVFGSSAAWDLLGDPYGVVYCTGSFLLSPLACAAGRFESFPGHYGGYMRQMNLDSLWTSLVSASGLQVLTVDTAFATPLRAGLDTDSRMVVAFRIYLTPLDREARVLYIKDPGGEWFVSGDLTLVNALNDRLADALISKEILADLASGQSVWLDLNA